MQATLIYVKTTQGSCVVYAVVRTYTSGQISDFAWVAKRPMTTDQSRRDHYAVSLFKSAGRIWLCVSSAICAHKQIGNTQNTQSKCSQQN